MGGLTYRNKSNNKNKEYKEPSWIKNILEEEGDDIRRQALSKDIKVPVNKNADYSKEDERLKKLRVSIIQRFLNVPVTGTWNKVTNDAYNKLLKETGFTPVELSERIRIAPIIDLETGNTRAFMRNQKDDEKKPSSVNTKNKTTVATKPSVNKSESEDEHNSDTSFSLDQIFGAIDRFLGNIFTPEKDQKEQIITVDTSKDQPTQSKKEKADEDKIQETYELIGLTPDVRSKTKSFGHSFKHTFDNNQGGSYIIGRKIAELKNPDGSIRDTTYEKSAGVAHFLMDADISPNQKKANTSYRTVSGDIVQSQYKDIFLPYLPVSNEDYIMQFKPKNDGSGEYLVRYKKLKDTGVTLDDIRKGKYISKDGWDTRYPIRSFDPENIDWDSNKGKSATLGKVPTLVTKDGKYTPIPSKSPDMYSRFSGASVVFVIDTPDGKSMAVDVAGSTGTIRKEYEKLKNQYKNAKIRMLVHDAGSYSFKPVSYEGLKQSSYVDFNTYNRGYSGAGLHIPRRLLSPETTEIIRKKYKQKNGGLIFRKGGSIKDLPCNKPKATPNHPTKSHVVKACEGGKQKIIRFGQQGVKGSPYKPGESEADRKRRLAFKARHAKNIAKGKMSAAYWSNKVKW